MRARSFPGLDVVRFAAALMVAIYHFGYWIPATGKVEALSFGWVGVEIFFVISGFVIAFSAERKSAAAYAKSRFSDYAPLSGYARRSPPRLSR